MRLMMERIFSEAGAIDLPDYEINKIRTVQAGS